jgi:hypothetical protein
MRTFLTLFALAAVCAGLAVADTWSGKLMDANCYAKEKGAKPCDAVAATTAFAVSVSGKVYNLDEGGNQKAAAALKNRADRSSDPNKPAAAVTAKITGTIAGDTIQVEAIELP